MYKKILLVIVFAISHLNAVEVKVLLDDDVTKGWQISAARGVILRNAETNKTYPNNATCHSFSITSDGHAGFLVNGRKMKATQAFIEPAHEGLLTWNGRSYDGTFFVTQEKGKWLLINNVDLEDYIYSVLKTESWPGWPLEVLKAQATGCRSYLLRQLLDARERSLPYNIKSTNYHQTYQGVHTDKIIHQAVEETRGIFLAHNEYPILAMFDCCCGGIIPAHIAEGIDFAKVPYLARTYACTYCKDWKLFSWKSSCSLDTFTCALQDIRSCVIHPVREVRVTKKDKAGLVQRVAVTTKKGDHQLKARDVYRMFKEVRSLCFTVRKKGKTLHFEGKGYGHHLGMCQWGARQMVDEGFSYREILAFYYPGTNFMKLTSDVVGNHVEHKAASKNDVATAVATSIRIAEQNSKRSGRFIRS